MLLGLQNTVYGHRNPGNPGSIEVDWGPYQGLHGSPVLDRYLHSLAKDLTPHLEAEGTVLFFDHFPAGYLLTPATPGTASIYTCHQRFSQIDPERCAADYAERMNEHSVAVHVPGAYINGQFSGLNRPVDRAMEALVARTHRKLLTAKDRHGTPRYQIYKARKRGDED